MNRENLLQVYCCLRHLNGKDKTIIYRQLIEIFGINFIEKWEKLFQETSELPYYQGRQEDEHNLPTLRLNDLEYMAIMAALEKKRFVQKNAAKELGISPRALNSRISFYEITHESWRKNGTKESNEY